jgi:hypothetical protein
MRTRFMPFIPILAIAALTPGCDDDGPDDDRYEATLAGSNEVDPNNSTATGTAMFTDRGGSFDYSIDVQNIDLPTAAHIHVGVAGVNGSVVVPLFSTSSPVADFSGRLVTGSFTAADIVATSSLSMEGLRDLMRTGGAYVNVHTTAIPGGEIRGQIGPD